MLPKIIAFTGQMGTGKTTAMQTLEIMLMQRGKSVRSVKFAGPLYRIQRYIYEQAKLPHPAEKDRELLQAIGTDWGRKKDPNIWVNVYAKDVTSYADLVDFVLTDDLRFENESDLIHSLGGTVVQMLAPQRIEVINGSHSSEQGIPDSKIDFKLRNDQGLDYLNHNLKLLVEHLGIRNG